MARTSQFSKKIIIEKALHLVSEHGIEVLTARTLSKALGCSTTPLFTFYDNIEELKKDVLNAAADKFGDYVKDSINYVPALKEFGLRLIRFSILEPNLFKLLFMTPGVFVHTMNPNTKLVLEAMKADFKLTDEQLNILLHQIWIFACGISMFVMSDVVPYDEEKASEMLSRQFLSTILLLKSNLKVKTITPHLREEGEGYTIPIPEI